MHSSASNKENQQQTAFFQGVTGSLWFSPTGGNYTMSLSGVIAVGEKSSHAYERFQKTFKKKFLFSKCY